MLQSPVAIKSPSVVDRSYRFAARRQGRTLFIEGYVPDERTIEQLLAFARKRFFNVAVSNQAQLHAGAPSGFMAGARFALEQLSFLATGEVILRDKSIRLSGEGLYSETAEQTVQTLRRSRPAGGTVRRALGGARKRQMRTPPLHASPARCHGECKTPGAVRRIAAPPRPGTTPALSPARLGHRPRAMMRAARSLGSSGAQSSGVMLIFVPSRRA